MEQQLAEMVEQVELEIGGHQEEQELQILGEEVEVLTV
jgi:hypothetical protein